tara:strand:+ start:475 stop:2007 length:1533 start_codon:yes stop_codon:yes gene_type:complete
MYPIIGIIFVSNILIILNFFLPLKSTFIYLLLFLILLINFYDFKKVKISLDPLKLFYFIVVPGILIFSSFDISYHYDAGYYHLNTQNWLRESNIIFGFVNIFWPLGMTSIYEYLSAALWLNRNFLLLHLIDIIFIHFFFVFVADSFFNPKYKEYKYMSVFILLFGVLDNFGFGGGRNGFLYFQGVGKQDIPLAILFFFISFTIFIFFKYKDISLSEIGLISIMSLFVFQLKVSSAIIFYVIGFLFYLTLSKKIFTLKKLIKSQTLFIFLSAIWFLKTYLTSGCFIFPLSVTCVNSFSWYIQGSTEAFEYISKHASLYFDTRQLTFIEWFQSFLSYDINRNVLFNFLISLSILGLFKFLVFTKNSDKEPFLKFVLFSFILINISYLIFFGPIPRYSIGIVLVIVSSFSLFIGNFKIKFNNSLFVALALLSVLTLVRISSYQAFLNNDQHNLFDPSDYEVINKEIGFTNFNENWVIPSEGDQCWTNLYCSMAKANIVISDDFFKTAYKEENN